MRFIRPEVILPCILAIVSTPAFAQQAPRPTQLPRQRAYVAAVTGASFGPETAAMFAGEYGERINRNTQAYINISYHENLMDSSISDDLSALNAGLTNLTGVTWNMQGRDRGVAMVAGARYLIGDGRIRPYLNGGAGIINIRRSIIDTRVGDVTSAVLNEFGIGELSLTSQAVTRPLVEGGAGVAVSAGRATYIDVGYRFRRAFQGSEPLDFGQFAAAVGVRF